MNPTTRSASIWLGVLVALAATPARAQVAPDHPLITEVYQDPVGPDDGPCGSGDLERSFIEIYIPPVADLAGSFNKDSLDLTFYEVEGDRSSSGNEWVNYRIDIPTIDVDGGSAPPTINLSNGGVVVLGWVDYLGDCATLAGTPSTRVAAVNGGNTSGFTFVAINGSDGGQSTTNFPVATVSHISAAERTSGIIQNGSGAYLLVNRDDAGYLTLCDDGDPNSVRNSGSCPMDPDLDGGTILGISSLVDAWAVNDDAGFDPTRQPFRSTDLVDLATGQGSNDGPLVENGAYTSQVPQLQFLGEIARSVFSSPSRTITFQDTNPDTIVVSSGNLLADGFYADMPLKVVGTLFNDGTFTIDTVTATTITLIAADALTNEVVSAGEVIDDKLSQAPGHERLCLDFPRTTEDTDPGNDDTTVDYTRYRPLGRFGPLGLPSPGRVRFSTSAPVFAVAEGPGQIRDVIAGGTARVGIRTANAGGDVSFQASVDSVGALSPPGVLTSIAVGPSDGYSALGLADPNALPVCNPTKTSDAEVFPKVEVVVPITATHDGSATSTVQVSATGGGVLDPVHSGIDTLFRVVNPTTGLAADGVTPFQATVFAALHGLSDDDTVTNEFLATDLASFVGANLGGLVDDERNNGPDLLNPATDLTDEAVVDPMEDDLPGADPLVWLNFFSSPGGAVQDDLVTTVLNSAEQVATGDPTDPTAGTYGPTVRRPGTTGPGDTGGVRAIQLTIDETKTSGGLFVPSESVHFVDSRGRLADRGSGLADVTTTRGFELALLDSNLASGFCSVNEEISCSSDLGCPIGQQCLSKRCSVSGTGCTSTAQCPPSELCLRLVESAANDDFGLVVEAGRVAPTSPVQTGEFIFLSFTGGLEGTDIDGTNVTPPGDSLVSIIYVDLDPLDTELGVETIKMLYVVDSGTTSGEVNVIEAFSLNVDPLVQGGGQQSADQQKCINFMNNDHRLVALKQGLDNRSCLVDGVKGKLPPGMTIEQCLTADLRNRVGAKTQKTVEHEATSCTPLAEPPDYAYTSAATVNQSAIDAAIDLTHDLFGPDLDAPGLIADIAVDRPRYICQTLLPKFATLCAKQMNQTFRLCKKDGLKGRDPTGLDPPLGPGPLEGQVVDGHTVSVPFVSGQDVAACMEHDYRGLIDRFCNVKLQTMLDRKCQANLDAFPGLANFPGCLVTNPPTSTSEIRDCMAERVSCRSCLALNQADALTRDCDLLDNGALDLSCP